MTPKKIITFAVGPLGAAFLSFLTLPVLTWFASVEDIGRVAMLQVLISFSFVLSSLGLDQAFVREYYEHKDKGLLFKAAAFPGFVFLIVLLISFIFVPFEALKGYFSLDNQLLICLASGCILINYVNTFFAHSLRMDEKGWMYSLSIIVPKMVFLILILFPIFLSITPDFHYFLTAQLFALMSTLLMLLISRQDILYGAFRSEFDVTIFKRLLRFGFPLVFGSVAYWGLTTFDRIALNWWSSLVELGIYSVAVSFAAVGIIFQSIFSAVWSPIVYKWAIEGLNTSKVDGVVEHVSAFVVAAFILVGLFSFVITYILPSQYFDVQYIVGSCLGFPLLYTLSETTVVGVHIKKNTIVAILAPLIAMPANIVFAYFLIPVYGAAGAAVATSIAFFIFFVVRTESSIRVWRPFPRAKIYFAVSGCLILSAIQALYGAVLGAVVQLVWGLVLIVMCVLFKDSCVMLKQYLKIKITRTLER